MNAADLAHALSGAMRCGDGWTARCPGPRHQNGRDRHQSLTIHDKPGDINPLVHCHTGCSQEELIEELTRRGLWEKPNGKTGHFSAAHAPGLTLAQYAEAKRLPVDFLRSVFNLCDATYQKAPAVEIRYHGENVADPYMVKFRIALTGDNMRWKKDIRPASMASGSSTKPKSEARSFSSRARAIPKRAGCTIFPPLVCLGLPAAGMRTAMPVCSTGFQQFTPSSSRAMPEQGCLTSSPSPPSATGCASSACQPNPKTLPLSIC